ncbi:hypothetical protein EVAR_97144_1 [Eumeta japonica]|uniref:Uncharacterized protein n=1 Tax=Eumeta variegata TaxID=151549 RepID=A0A4C1SL90_EUMVA|nr:hypothetical protein EVAR_97144_1 [Eumeta japonica]
MLTIDSGTGSAGTRVEVPIALPSMGNEKIVVEIDMSYWRVIESCPMTPISLGPGAIAITSMSPMSCSHKVLGLCLTIESTVLIMCSLRQSWVLRDFLTQSNGSNYDAYAY